MANKGETTLSLVSPTRVYCDRCKKGLHNMYKWNGGKSISLIKMRCKGEVLSTKKSEIIKCECLCQTHYTVNGHLIPIGCAPAPEQVTTPEAKPLAPLPQEVLDWNEKNQQERLQAEKQRQKRNSLLGTAGDEGDTATLADEPDIMAGYATPANIAKALERGAKK